MWQQSRQLELAQLRLFRRTRKSWPSFELILNLTKTALSENEISTNFWTRTHEIKNEQHELDLQMLSEYDHKMLVRCLAAQGQLVCCFITSWIIYYSNITVTVDDFAESLSKRNQKRKLWSADHQAVQAGAGLW